MQEEVISLHAFGVRFARIVGFNDRIVLEIAHAQLFRAGRSDLFLLVLFAAFLVFGSGLGKGAFLLAVFFQGRVFQRLEAFEYAVALLFLHKHLHVFIRHFGGETIELFAYLMIGLIQLFDFGNILFRQFLTRVDLIEHRLRSVRRMVDERSHVFVRVTVDGEALQRAFRQS